MAKNSLGREIPALWRGRSLAPYLDPWSRKPGVLRSTRPLVRLTPGDGVTSSASGATVHLRWSEFSGFLETDRVFVLQRPAGGKGTFAVLAKRGLDPATGVSELRDLLTRQTRRAR